MLELFINRQGNSNKIALVKNGKLVEFYEEDTENKNEGNIYLGIVKDVLKGMESAFVDIGTEKNSYIGIKEILPKVDEAKEEYKNDIKIENVIKPNDMLLVQVKKDSNELKGARISTHINLPGKYIVLMPDTNIVTVSQKIEDKKEQERLVNLVKENLNKNNGAIIRTSAYGKNQEIIDNIKDMENKWKEIKQQFNEQSKQKNPKTKLLYKSQSIVQKMLLDLPSKEISKIISNSKQEIEEIKKYIKNIEEYKDIKFELIENQNIFDTYEIDNQIEKIYKRKIWLKCGGFITIDKTEALTAIDVNTGKFTSGKNFADITYKVNEQATIEIAKQLRLRDIGGIVIIDYIDMKKNGDKEKIEKLLKECLKEDRAKTQVEGFTKLNLMELTRKHICSHKN